LLIPITNSAFPHPSSKARRPWGDRRPILLLDVDRGEKPQGYPLPLDDVSALYGNRGARLVWTLSPSPYAGHHRILNSPFLRRPITLKREDGGDFDASSLNEPLGPLDEDFEVGNKALIPLNACRGRFFDRGT